MPSSQRTATGTQSPQTRSLPRERATPKSGLSCRRCQKRKIRCNGGLPRCSNCAKIGVECIDGESSRSRTLPREYINSLTSRIKWLESIIRHRCPDIDLEHDGPSISQGPYEPDGTDLNNEDNPSADPRRFGTQTEHEVTNATNFETSARITTHHSDIVTHPPSTPTLPLNTGLSHEIGLVSLGVNQDPRYIGPSSGFVLSKLMLAASNRTGKVPRVYDRSSTHIPPYLGEIVVENQAPISIGQDQAIKLCQTYFDIIHVQYPFLHQKTFFRSLRQFYDDGNQSATTGFQVYMVLAISATIASRLYMIPLSGERYYMSAMKYFDKMPVEGSIHGLQCLLLLLVFAMHSPSVKLNIWYLNYQCIASVLDLGLQREITTSNSGISKLDQEMRTRIFWVVYTLDRTIATMMGRPIGLRDEACDLRLPEDKPDNEDEDDTITIQGNCTRIPTHMSYAIRLFKLARINSEIKYVANSVNRSTPSFAYPTMVNLHAWQNEVLRQLDEWATDIPQAQNIRDYTHAILLLRYHSVRMLLLRPSPAIPRPDEETLRKCYSSAEESIRLFNQLYKNNLLVHNWMTFHTIVLSTVTMLYCIFSVQSIAATLEIENVTSNIQASLSVLSAVGEHWSGAKRSRDILDELASPLISWLVKKKQRQEEGGPGALRQPLTNSSSPRSSPPDPSDLSFTLDSADTSWPGALPEFDSIIDGRLLSEQYGVMDSSNLDDIVLSLFDDFMPSVPQFM
ncbi:fungal-specific transcription factor domain-containing protein [Biscogniauxia mediterranea]|nr:fungal-specific transcription factor domain-containing protein [Biscogniauxia mediterranea]